MTTPSFSRRWRWIGRTTRQPGIGSSSCASVQFSDGSPLTPADVVASLQSSLGKGFDVIAAENGVAIRSAHPAPDLLEQLASGSNFIFRRKPDATLLGTGPFFVVE